MSQVAASAPVTVPEQTKWSQFGTLITVFFFWGVVLKIGREENLSIGGGR